MKELNLVDRRWTYHADDVFRFEQAAFAAGSVLTPRLRSVGSRSSTSQAR